MSNSVTIVRRMAASVDTVFDAISTPEGIAAWWGPDAGPVLSAEIDARVGGQFRVRFRMLDGSEHECFGEVLELVRPERLAMSWNWLGNEGEGESRIEAVLKPVALTSGTGTELVFTHSLLHGEEEAEGHREGWNGSFDKLERLLVATSHAPAA